MRSIFAVTRPRSDGSSARGVPAPIDAARTQRPRRALRREAGALQRIAEDIGGVKAMRKRLLFLAATVSATILFMTITVWACPRSYVPCGEKQQLCCPR
jgi:hypothetical protein